MVRDKVASFLLGIAFCMIVATILFASFMPLPTSGTGMTVTTTCPMDWGGKPVPVTLLLRYRWDADGNIKVLWGTGCIVGAEKK